VDLQSDDFYGLRYCAHRISLLATSAIGCETDIVVQNSLRANLGSGVTLFTIAHRFQTTMGAGRIVNDIGIVL